MEICHSITNNQKGGIYIMYKKIILLVLSISLIFTISFLYFTNENKTANTAMHMESTDTQLINNIIEIEKNLVLAQIHKLLFDEFKNKTDSFIHSYYKDGYFGELEKLFLFDGSGDLASSTKTPVYQYVSKVYTSKDKAYKNIFIKIPVEGTTSQVVKLYVFKIENEEWQIFSVKGSILVIEKNRPKEIIEKFSKYDGVKIEYEYIKILE